MILGRFRDDLPHIVMELAGISGPVKVEFIVDTGFDGYLTLPPSIMRRLHATPLFESVRALGDGTLREFSAYEVILQWGEKEHAVEALVVEHVPLMVTLAMAECLLSVDL